MELLPINLISIGRTNITVILNSFVESVTLSLTGRGKTDCSQCNLKSWKTSGERKDTQVCENATDTIDLREVS